MLRPSDTVNVAETSATVCTGSLLTWYVMDSAPEASWPGLFPGAASAVLMLRVGMSLCQPAPFSGGSAAIEAVGFIESIHTGNTPDTPTLPARSVPDTLTSVLPSFVNVSETTDKHFNRMRPSIAPCTSAQPT